MPYGQRRWFFCTFFKRERAKYFPNGPCSLFSNLIFEDFFVFYLFGKLVQNCLFFQFCSCCTNITVQQIVQFAIRTNTDSIRENIVFPHKKRHYFFFSRKFSKFTHLIGRLGKNCTVLNGKKASISFYFHFSSQSPPTLHAVVTPDSYKNWLLREMLRKLGREGTNFQTATMVDWILFTVINIRFNVKKYCLKKLFVIQKLILSKIIVLLC